MTRASAFRAGLTDPAADVPQGLTDGAGAPAGRRYDVYRNNVMQSLTDVLRAGFPVVRKLLGDANFDGLAATFIRNCPPTSPIMQHYGAEFPTYLASVNALKHIGYLADAARLDQQLRVSYHAADATAVDPARLGELMPDQLARCTAQFAPAVALIQSDWPLWDIWHYNTQTGAAKPRPFPQHVLITRAEFDPEPHPLSPAQGAWVAAWMAGADLGTATETAQTQDADCDISAPLSILIAQNALTGLTTKDPT